MNKTIRVYGWHPITKEPLQGEFYADESPLEDGVYHLPQYTTKKSVPALKEHECALYDETSDDWVIVADYRGDTLYSKTDGELFVIEKLGDIPENLTLFARPSKAHDWDGKQWVLNSAKQSELEAQEKSIAEAQFLEQKRAEKRAALDSIVVTTSSGKIFDGNETARVNMLSAITASEISGQTDSGWKLADNTLAMVNVSEIKEALALSIMRVGQIVSEG